jgi:hypothetical protein
MIHIVTHILPQEIDQLESLLTILKRSSKYLNRGDYFVEVVLNNKLTDWEQSKLSEEFFINKFNHLETLTSSWCKTKFEVSDGTILGCNDIRRRALRTSTADYIMYLDADNIFSDTMLYHMNEATKELSKDKYSIIVPQTTRLWDTSWDVITHHSFYNEMASHENYFNRDPYLESGVIDEVSLLPIGTFKFAGWGTTISTNIRNIIDIPDSLGPYGVDDTFIMFAASILKQKGVDIEQYVLNNEVIIENNKFRFNPYKDILVTIDRRKEFLDNAHANFDKELQKYYL